VSSGSARANNTAEWIGWRHLQVDRWRAHVNTGPSESRHIARIVVDPVDHDGPRRRSASLVPNRERGVYKTTDGGVT
jgi:hypothetical protein